MLSFLEKVSGYIFENYSENVSELSIVLPNKRAGLFLKMHLAEKFRKTIWSPKIYSIEDFVVELSGLTVPEPAALLFEFYNIYKKAEGQHAQQPDEFIRWANVLLNDFNEIDLYVADAKELFTYLNEIRAIEQWNPQSRELSAFQKQYLNFWNSLGMLYKDFSEELLQKNMAYQGLAYRIAAEKIKNKKQETGNKILFVGFNALTKAEEIILEHFLENEQAEILWDADKYYMENEMQEAGKFLRKEKKNFSEEKEKNFLWEFDILKTDKKEIEIIGVAGNVAQAKVAGEILANHFPTGNRHTEHGFAIVLADETLLLPVLNSLPEKAEVNVTMGYPLKNSPLHHFWNALFKLHENVSRSNEKIYFYHKEIIQVLSHPFLSFSEEIISISHTVISEIKNKNKIYISGEELVAQFQNSELKNLFSDWRNEPETAIETALNLLAHRIGEKSFDAEFSTRFQQIFEQIKLLQTQYKIMNDLRTLRIVFNQLAASYKVPFSGEPLKGLQIMGMLETRALDFETVILLSANEDILPSGKSLNSFIPFDIKKQFNLPTYSDRDAIFAYHFYRLLQRAKKVFILYNNDVSKSFGSGAGEKSRFITQIQEELPKTNPNIKITEKIISFPQISKNEKKLSIAKTEEIIKRLNELSEKGFSPTSINTFRNCPLDFYFKYIIGLREENEVEETVEAAQFGNYIHLSLQNLYAPVIGKNIHEKDILTMKQQADQTVRASFLEEYSERDISSGKNFLSLKVAQKYVSSFLNKEIEFLKKLETHGEHLTVLALEKEMEIEMENENRKFKFKIRGKADRIDKIGNTIRIIDYKTGNVEPYDLKIESAEITSFEKQKPKALQLLMYALIFSKEYLTPKGFKALSELNIQTGIISLKKLSEGFMPLTIDGIEIIEKNSLHIFEKELGKIISEMYEPSLLFEHNHEAKYCEFCG